MITIFVTEPVAVLSAPNETVAMDEKVTLICEVRGYPRADVTWHMVKPGDAKSRRMPGKHVSSKFSDFNNRDPNPESVEISKTRKKQTGFITSQISYNRIAGLIQHTDRTTRAKHYVAISLHYSDVY